MLLPPRRCLCIHSDSGHLASPGSVTHTRIRIHMLHSALMRCTDFSAGHFRDESDPEQGHVPDYIKGKLTGRGGGFTFCTTERELKMGMCGGPVLDSSGKCAGVVEAIVATDGPIKGQAVVVETDVVANFLNEVSSRGGHGGGDGIVWN
jgi:hypothetical protein